MATLTERHIKSLKPKKSPYRVYDTGKGGVNGLHIQVSAKGKLSWTLRYRVDGKKQFQKLGSFPAIGLADARIKANKLTGEIELGGNPKEIKVEKASATLGELMDAYLDDVESRGAKTINNMRSLYNNVPVAFRKIKAGEITPADIHEILRPVAKRAPTCANRVHQLISSAFNWGLRQEFALNRDRDTNFNLTTNPLTMVPKIREAEKVSDVVLSMRNVAAAWVHVMEYQSVTTALAIRFHIANGGIRVLDSVERRWDEIIKVDGQRAIYIPKTKTGKPHTIPLGRMAAQVLEEAKQFTEHCEVIFPQRNSRKKPVTYMALGQATRKIKDRYNAVGSFSPRYLRRTAKTQMGNAGVDRVNLDYLHAHVIRGVSEVGSKHYDRSHHLKEKKIAMDAWNELLAKAIADYEAELDEQ